MSPDSTRALERIVKRDRLIVSLGLLTITVVAWAYLLREGAAVQSIAAETRMHTAMGMGDMQVWGFADWVALFVMWAVMMTGMMLPSAAPMILLVLGMLRRRGDRRARVSAIVFVGGYLVTWTAFAALAAAVQVGLHRTAMLTPEMASRSGVLAAGILIAAGIYQWLPIKSACLTHCRSPLGFLTQHWREGVDGALGMGVRHGLFCVGCCWAVMALLFVVGVMNLVWVAIIAIFVLAERLLPRGSDAGLVAGVLLILWGIYAVIA